MLLNGRPVATGTSLFVPVQAELGEILRAGENLLEVRLRSPEREALERSRRLPYPVPHTQYPVQSPHRNLLRKVQCHAGWDWGPCLMPSGIYGPAFLASSAEGRLEHLHTESRLDGRDVELTVQLEYFAFRAAELPGRANFSGLGEQQIVSQDLSLVLEVSSEQEPARPLRLRRLLLRDDLEPARRRR